MKPPETITLLLIEDNPGDADLIQELLTEIVSIRLIHVDRLAAGYVWLTAKAIDLILLDLSLPDSQGLDTFVAAQARAPQIPIIVLTGLDDETTALKALKAGAQDYLVKGRLDARDLGRSIRYAIERAHSRAAIDESRQFLRSTLDALTAHIAILDASGTIIAVNSAWRQFADDNGLNDPSYGVGQNYLAICDVAGNQGYPEASVAAMSIRALLTQEQERFSLEYPCYSPKERHWYLMRGTSFDTDDVRIVLLHEDISELKQVEERLTTALREKEVLLKETHHRVKNNLQIISSLLNLQAENLDDPQVREPFLESQRRIRAMALVHEQLYQSADLARIAATDYIQLLVNYLVRSFQPISANVAVHMAIDEIMLDIDRAIPLGLIINELVSNSLKHAFPNTMTGKIWVALHHDATRTLTLTVGDTGIGMPLDLDMMQTGSLGLQLVQALAKQLHADLSCDRRNGTIVTLTIPAKSDDHT